jgi:SAM-dependent methyltransferase
MLADRYEEVLAVDLSKPMLDLARARRARPNITYDRCDLRDLHPERDGRFDLLLSACTLHHVPEQDLPEAVEGLRDLIVPGGLVVLVDIVDPRGRVPVWRHRADAARRLAGDLLRRGPGTALEIYGARTHPAWLAHVASDRFLTPDQFRGLYEAVFPGAAFTRIDRALALTWHAPDPAARARTLERRTRPAVNTDHGRTEPGAAT